MMNREKPLLGQVALVTGGSRGLGQAICRELAVAGADVAFFFVNNHESAQSTVNQVSQQGRLAKSYVVDITKSDDVKTAIDGILATFGKIDILVNNAGLVRDQLCMRLQKQDWHDVLDVNLHGTFYTTQAVLRQMIKRRFGRIINISSVVGLMGNVGQANYATAKAGLFGFTKSLAREVAQRGITVNALAPGYIKTDMTRALTNEQQEAILAMIPMRRYGNADEVAKLVVFISTEGASYMTGNIFRIDGGMAMG